MGRGYPPSVREIWLSTAQADDFAEWAATPPMGWNSWDAYGQSVPYLLWAAWAAAEGRRLAPESLALGSDDILPGSKVIPS